jgi:hypothetical protein
MQMYAAHSKPVRVLKAFLVAMRLLWQVPLPRSYADARQLARMAGVRLPAAARSLFSRRAASQFAADAAYSVKLLRLIAWAAGDYRPQPFAGRAVLFRTGAAAHDPQDPMRRDLERFATGGVTVRPVPGTHMSMILNRRDVAALAAALREFLPAGPSAS